MATWPPCPSSPSLVWIATGPLELTAVLTPAEEGGDVAFDPETGTTTEGESIEEAPANLRDATSFAPIPGAFLPELAMAV